MGKEFFHKRDRFLFGGNPVNVLVALEPGHLSLCVTDDVMGKLLDHPVASDELAKVSTDPSVFEAKVVEAFPAYAIGVEPFDFFKHAGLDAFFESHFDQRPQCFRRACDADQKKVIGG